MLCEATLWPLAHGNRGPGYAMKLPQSPFPDISSSAEEGQSSLGQARRVETPFQVSIQAIEGRVDNGSVVRRSFRKNLCLSARNSTGAAWNRCDVCHHGVASLTLHGKDADAIQEICCCSRLENERCEQSIRIL
jgi:hypothetical protein